jgi:uncharacterized membrane protein YfcA
VIIAALLGHWMGKQVIDRVDDDFFKRIGRVAIFFIGIAYIGRGLDE